jgi:hypothetical protein
MENKYFLGFPGQDLMVVVEATSLEQAIKQFRKSFPEVEPEMVTETGVALAAKIERSYKPYNAVAAMQKGANGILSEVKVYHQ